MFIPLGRVAVAHVQNAWMLWQSLMMDWRNKTYRLWVILYYIILYYVILYANIWNDFPFFKPSSRECEHIKHAYVYTYMYIILYVSFWDIQKYLSFHCPTFMPCHHWLTQWSLDIARLACDKSNHTQLGYDMINCNLATWFVPYVLLVINFTTSRYWCGISAGDTGMIPGNEAFGHLEGLHIIPIGGMHLYTQ